MFLGAALLFGPGATAILSVEYQSVLTTNPTLFRINKKDAVKISGDSGLLYFPLFGCIIIEADNPFAAYHPGLAGVYGENAVKIVII